MKLSEKRKSDLYSAVREPIMDMRLAAGRCDYIGSQEIDEKLFFLEREIWKQVKKALNLKEQTQEAGNE